MQNEKGKLYSGIGVQSAKVTLFTAHLVLPFQKVKDRMEQRAMMRRSRRGRRINRNLAFNLRAHHQKRFNNRRGSKLPPSIRANRQLELRVVSELCKVFPVSCIVYEIVEAKGSKSFSPVMVGQKWMLTQLAEFAPVEIRKGWETSQLRTQLGLQKQKHQKGDPIPATHAVDGIALACSTFIQYASFHSAKSHGHQWTGKVLVTTAPFKVIRRPPISRRQLHLMVPAKGGIRRKYGGTTGTSIFRKGDLVRSVKWIGFVSGEKADGAPSISDSNWKRLGYVSAKKVELIRRSTGLVVHGH
jgi:RRXRR protein